MTLKRQTLSLRMVNHLTDKQKAKILKSYKKLRHKFIEEHTNKYNVFDGEVRKIVKKEEFRKFLMYAKILK